jgi:glycosyltransferase involved in cell wall biosynthesis
MNPAISIITCSLNSASTLVDTHQSLLGLCKNSPELKFEWIIVDSSDDDSVKNVIKNSTLNLRYFKVPPEGIYSAMNFGAKQATGRYLWFLNSDDFVNFDRFKLDPISKKMEAGTPIFFGRVQWITANKTKVLGSTFFNPLYKLSKLACYPPHPATLVNRHCFDHCGGFDENFDISGDFDLFLKIVKLHNLNIDESLYISSLMVSMRVGGTSSNGFRAELKKIYQDMMCLRRNGFSLWIVILKRITKGWFLIASR